MKEAITSHFKEKPKTKIAWWAMGISAATLAGLFWVFMIVGEFLFTH